MVPKLILNKLIHGRYIDVLVTHAPPAGIHDQKDHTHQGFKAFNWLLKVFKPAYHFHGHIHIYDSDTVKETTFQATKIINTFSLLFNL